MLLQILIKGLIKILINHGTTIFRYIIPNPSAINNRIRGVYHSRSTLNASHNKKLACFA